MAGGLVYYIVLRIDVFLQFADVVKLVYTYARGAYAARCGGSSPLVGTTLPDRLMVGQHPLEVFIEVRILVGQHLNKLVLWAKDAYRCKNGHLSFSFRAWYLESSLITI